MSTSKDANPILVTLSEIQTAHSLISPYLHRTPLLTNSTIDSIVTKTFFPSASNTRITIAFKAEHLQKIGAFKARGATNAVQIHLERAKEELKDDFDPEKLCVLTHSSGNHAGAVAFAAKTFGCKAAVVMPRTAPKTKREAVEGYGARVVECEPTLSARQETADKLIKELESQGLVVRFIHPYDEALVIAGQGTLALEMMEQAKSIWGRGQNRKPCSAAIVNRDSSNFEVENEPPLEVVIAPIGGGGMMSGVSTAVKGLDSRVRVVGAEPEIQIFLLVQTKKMYFLSILLDPLQSLEADDAYRSFHSGILQPPLPPTSICDGLLTALSPLTLSHIRKNVDLIALVSEESVLKSMKLIWERMKQIVEPSACVGLAALLEPKEEMKTLAEEIVKEKRRKLIENGGKGDEAVEVKIGIVWSGGNVELGKVLKSLDGIDSL